MPAAGRAGGTTRRVVEGEAVEVHHVGSDDKVIGIGEVAAVFSVPVTGVADEKRVAALPAYCSSGAMVIS